jgi:hypothetical protein
VAIRAVPYAEPEKLSKGIIEHYVKEAEALFAANEQQRE